MNREHFSTAVDVFISYAHQDEEYRRQLDTHLSLLRRQEFLRAWHDRKIAPGAQEIDDHLDNAAIVLLLVSGDFLASDYCWEVEMRRELARHANAQYRRYLEANPDRQLTNASTPRSSRWSG